MDPVMQEISKAAAELRKGVEALSSPGLAEKVAGSPDAAEAVRMEKLAGMYEDLLFVDLVEADLAGQL